MNKENIFRLAIIVLAALGIILCLTLPLIQPSGMASGIGSLFGASDLLGAATQMMALFPLAQLIAMYSPGAAAVIVIIFLVSPVLAGLGVYHVIRKKDAKILFIISAAVTLVMGIILSNSLKDSFGLLEIGNGVVLPMIFFILCAVLSFLLKDEKGRMGERLGEKMNAVKDAAAKKNLDKKKIGIIAGIAAAVVVVVVIVANLASYTTINPHELYTVTFEGLDGEGTAILEVNEEKMTEITAELEEKNGKRRESDVQAFFETMAGSFESASAVRSIQFEAIPAETLSNGDEISVEVLYDEEFLKEYQVKLQSDAPAVYIVEGLVVPEEIDVFDGLALTFEGIAPYLEVSYDTSQCHPFAQENVQFEVPGATGLLNGDTITVAASYYPESEREYAVKVLADTKDYTIEGQLEYIQSIDGLDLTPLLTEMDDMREATVAASMGKSRFGNSSLSGNFTEVLSLQGQGTYFLNEKQAEEDYWSGNENNRCAQFYVYDILTTDYWGAQDTRTRYMMVTASNIWFDETGVLQWGDIEVTTDSDNILVDNYTTGYQDAYHVTLVGGPSEAVYAMQPEAGAAAEAAADVPGRAAAFDENGFVFGDSSERLLTEDELRALPPLDGYTQLQLLGFARNEIFARYGNEFESKAYIDHYSQYEWYNALPKSKIDNFEAIMNPTEIANIFLIQSIEAQLV